MTNMDLTRNTIRAVISRVLGIDAASISDSSQLGVDLETDSLNLMEIALGVEDACGIRIPDDEYPHLRSVTAIAAKVQELRSQTSISGRPDAK
jgi:acyl carrier protein